MFPCSVVQDNNPWMKKIWLPKALKGDLILTPIGIAKIVFIEEDLVGSPILYLEKMSFPIKLPEISPKFFKTVAWSEDSAIPHITVILCDLIHGIYYDVVQQREFIFARDEDIIIRDKLYRLGWVCWNSANKQNRAVVYLHLFEVDSIRHMPLSEIPLPNPEVSKVRSVSNQVYPAIAKSARPFTPPPQVPLFTDAHIGSSLQPLLEQFFIAEERESLSKDSYKALYAKLNNSELKRLQKVLHSALYLLSYQSSFEHAHLDKLHKLSVAARFAWLFSTSMQYEARIPLAFNHICADMSSRQLAQYKGLFFAMLHDLHKMSALKSAGKSTSKLPRVVVMREQQPGFENSEYRDLPASRAPEVTESPAPEIFKTSPTKTRSALPKFMR